MGVGVTVRTGGGAESEAWRAGYEREGEEIIGGDAALSRMHARAEPSERELFESIGGVSESATMRTMARRPDGADQALAELQARTVDRFAFQPFGGEQLEARVATPDIDRAHLRHHVGGDGHDDLVESFLRVDRLRHQFAEPSKHHARAADRTPHSRTCP